MKRKFIFFILTIIITIFCTACGNGLPTEKTMIQDLISNPEFNMIEGSEIQELDIIKRLTNEENKTDTVYVTITIDHENATATEAYIMYYTHYNEGWMLDDIEMYYDEEYPYTTTPKNAPSSEYIMEALVARSNSQIESAQNGEIIFTTGFFANERSSTTIYPGEFVTPQNYNCIAETKRVFNYMEVTETQLLSFYFDDYLYDWVLSFDAIINLEGEPYYEGEWSVPTSGAILQFKLRGNMGTYATYDVTCNVDGQTFTDSFTVTFPSTQSIDLKWSTIGGHRDPITLKIGVSPDIVWFYDNNGNYNIESVLSPTTLAQIPPELDQPTLITISTSEKEEPYIDMAKTSLNDIFFNSNSEYIREHWHPTCDYSLSYAESFIQFSDSVTSITPMDTTVIDKNKLTTESDKEAMQIFSELLGTSTDEITQNSKYSEFAISTFYLEFMYDNRPEYYKFFVFFVKEGDEIYICGIDS